MDSFQDELLKGLVVLNGRLPTVRLVVSVPPSACRGQGHLEGDGFQGGMGGGEELLDEKLWSKAMDRVTSRDGRAPLARCFGGEGGGDFCVV